MRFNPRRPGRQCREVCRTAAGSIAAISIALHANRGPEDGMCPRCSATVVATSTGESFVRNRAPRPADSSRAIAAGTGRASSSQARRTMVAKSSRGKSAGHHQHWFALTRRTSRARDKRAIRRDPRKALRSRSQGRNRAQAAPHPIFPLLTPPASRSMRGSEIASRRTQRIVSLPRREAPAPSARATSTRWRARR